MLCIKSHSKLGTETRQWLSMSPSPDAFSLSTIAANSSMTVSQGILNIGSCLDSSAPHSTLLLNLTPLIMMTFLYFLKWWISRVRAFPGALSFSWTMSVAIGCLTSLTLIQVFSERLPGYLPLLQLQPPHFVLSISTSFLFLPCFHYLNV